MLENQGRRHKSNFYSVFPWPPAQPPLVLERPTADKFGLPTARQGSGITPKSCMYQLRPDIADSGFCLCLNQSGGYRIIVGWQESWYSSTQGKLETQPPLLSPQSLGHQSPLERVVRDLSRRAGTFLHGSEDGNKLWTPLF